MNRCFGKNTEDRAGNVDLGTEECKVVTIMLGFEKGIGDCLVKEQGKALNMNKIIYRK